MSGKKYDRLSRILHSLALRKIVAELSFDIERSIHGRGTPAVTGKEHVFVCGLARAGTTVLMRHLHGSGDFASLTYRDMPFPLAPNLWRSAWKRSKREGVVEERAHGDGIKHSFDSPEALEEIFWSIQFGSSYIHEDHLSPMKASPGSIKLFREYVALVLKAKQAERYLSKNNNNILRLELITEAFPSAWILAPIRDPLEHALSLHRQHVRFLEQQKEDPFILKYMNWLGHFEFGAGHRAMKFDESHSFEERPENLNYWLEIWIHCHQHLAKCELERVIPVCYEQLCESPVETWESLGRKLNLPGPVQADFRRPSSQAQTGMFRGDLLKLAYEIQDALRVKAFQPGLEVGS